MRIFLTGGSGFIGGHLLAELIDRGHTVVALMRSQEPIARLTTAYPVRFETVVAPFTEPASWTSALAGCDVLINTIGIIRDSPRATFATVHSDAPIAAFDAALAAGVNKVIQLSALGADGAATSAFHLSKRVADKHLSQLDIDQVVFRPSFVYGPGCMSTALFSAMACQPITTVPGDGQMRMQPMHVDDLVHAMADAAENTRPERRVFDVGGPKALTFDAMLDLLGQAYAGRPARKLHIPLWVMRTAAWCTDTLGFGPVTGDELGMLLRGNVCDMTPFINRFEFTPMTMERALALQPPSQADRWQARLAPWQIPIRLSVASIWIATALVSAFFYPYEESLALLADTGITGPLADVALYGTCALEMFIGLATAIGWRVRWMAAIQLVLITGFTIILSATSPAFWIHPFGPLTKNIPLIGATIAMIALED